jgi:hypothetical protein
MPAVCPFDFLTERFLQRQLFAFAVKAPLVGLRGLVRRLFGIVYALCSFHFPVL